MITNRTLHVATAALLIALGGTAKAATLTAGPAYGGVGQYGGRVFCQLFNTGTTNATITTRAIFNDSSGPLPLVYDACNRTLFPARSCVYFVNATAGAYTCRAITSADANVTGTMEIFTNVSDEHLLVMVPMTK
jgi:hypothetical protein